MLSIKKEGGVGYMHDEIHDSHEAFVEVQRCLWFLRQGTANYKFWIQRLRDIAGNGSELIDWDTSEEELEELRVEGCRAMAHKSLDTLRGGGVDKSYARILSFSVRNAAYEGDFSLADIGTDQEKLASLVKAQA